MLKIIVKYNIDIVHLYKLNLPTKNFFISYNIHTKQFCCILIYIIIFITVIFIRFGLMMIETEPKYNIKYIPTCII